MQSISSRPVLVGKAERSDFSKTIFKTSATSATFSQYSLHTCTPNSVTLHSSPFCSFRQDTTDLIMKCQMCSPPTPTSLHFHFLFVAIYFLFLICIFQWYYEIADHIILIREYFQIDLDSYFSSKTNLLHVFIDSMNRFLVSW